MVKEAASRADIKGVMKVSGMDKGTRITRAIKLLRMEMDQEPTGVRIEAAEKERWRHLEPMVKKLWSKAYVHRKEMEKLR